MQFKSVKLDPKKNSALLSDHPSSILGSVASKKVLVSRVPVHFSGISLQSSVFEGLRRDDKLIAGATTRYRC